MMALPTIYAENPTSAELESDSLGLLSDVDVCSEIDSLSVGSSQLSLDSDPGADMATISESSESDDELIVPSESDTDSDTDCGTETFWTGPERETEDQPQDQCVFNTPLYEGAKLTIFDSFVLLLQFSLRFQLAGVALEALFKLVCTLLPQPNTCVSSLYKLRKLCSSFFPDMRSSQYSYCKACFAPAGRCDVCEHCGNTTIGRFLVADIKSQLKEKFKDVEFWKGLQSREASSSGLKDIYDGFEYRQHSKPGGFLCKHQNPANVSFLLNTDGVALFKSSSTDIWPVFLAINELPPFMRFSKKHLLLVGLWYGSEKPFMLTYLQPIVEQLNHLYYEGVQVITPDGVTHNSRAMLLLSSCDLPAKALVSNMKAYNGKYGCTICEDTGEGSSNPLHRIWPFREVNVIRTKQECYKSIRQAVEKKEAVMGFKGVPALVSHPAFDIVKGTVIDYLHCVLLGVTKTLLKMWIDPKYSTHEFYIGKQYSLLDKLLTTIKVPDIIRRPPRSLKERKHWKGTEWQYWLLFYSLPLLSGILPNVYYLHYCALVCAIAMLVSGNISEGDLDKASVLLKEFHRHAGDLYGSAMQTMNVHLLRHLVFNVRNWGPLWSYSCFGFESVNGELKKLFHGTRDMSQQMIFSFHVMQNLPQLMKFLSPLAITVLGKFSGESKRSGRETQQFQGMCCIGSSKVIMVEDSIGVLMEALCKFKPVTAVKFWRLRVYNTIYYSLEYHRTHSRNSYTVRFGDNQYGVIQYFIAVNSGSDSFVFAIVSVLLVQQFRNLPHLFMAQDTGFVKPIFAKSVVSKCVSLIFGSNFFIGVFPSSVLPLLS